MFDHGRFSPWWLVAVAVVGGVLIGRRGGEAPNGDARIEDTQRVRPSAHGRRQRVLAPLLEFAGLPLTDSPDRDLRKALQRLGVADGSQERGWTIGGMIVCTPDPVDSVVGFRFDLMVDTLQKAMAEHDFVLDRYYLPWDADRAGNDAPEEETDRRFRSEPGLLLFRNGAEDALKLVFLVGETPSSGIHKPAFQLAVKLIRTLTYHQDEQDNNEHENKATELLILGPTYTGSADSLAMAVRELLAGKPRPADTASESEASGESASDGEPQRQPPDKVHIVTGTATAIDKCRFFEIADPCREKVTFEATILPTKFVQQQLLQYLVNRHSNFSTPLHIAWLTESTGFGEATRRDESEQIDAGEENQGQNNAQQQAGEQQECEQRECEQEEGREDELDGVELIQFPFPLHVSRVRRAFDLQRSEQDMARPRLGPKWNRLNIPFDGGEQGRDVLPQFAPRLTASIVELDLAQILATISRDGIQYVGITATDPRDQIFLASMLREFCPDVQLLLLSSELLYTHADYGRYLNGTIVASSYPLYYKNQHWSFPYTGGTKHVVLASELHQGTYNAVQALLGTPQKLLEYGPPFAFADGTATCARQYKEKCRPPVWISVVGRYGMWPLHVTGYVKTPDRQHVAMYTIPSEDLKEVENRFHDNDDRDEAAKAKEWYHFNIRLPLPAALTVSGLLAFVLFNVAACGRGNLFSIYATQGETRSLGRGLAAYFRPPGNEPTAAEQVPTPRERGAWVLHMLLCLSPLLVLTEYLVVLLMTPMLLSYQLKAFRDQSGPSLLIASVVLLAAFAAAWCLKAVQNRAWQATGKVDEAGPEEHQPPAPQSIAQAVAAYLGWPLMMQIVILAAAVVGGLVWLAYFHGDDSHPTELFRECLLLILALLLGIALIYCLLRLVGLIFTPGNAWRPANPFWAHPWLLGIAVFVQAAMLLFIGIWARVRTAPFNALVLHFERASHLSSGLSPLVPIAGLVAAFYIWGLMRLKRRVLSVSHKVEAPWPEKQSDTERLQDVHQQLREALSAPCSSLRKRSIAVYVIVFGLATVWIGFLWMHATAVFDGTPVSIIFWSAIAAFVILWTHWFWETLHFSWLLRRLLRTLSWLPFQDAFLRMPDKVSMAIGRFLAPQAPGERNRTIRQHYLQQINQDLNDLRSHHAERLPVGSPIATKDFGASVADASRAVWKHLSVEWPRKEIRHAYPQFVEAGRTLPRSEPAERGTLEALRERAEEFLAIQVVAYVSQFFAHFRNGLYLLVAAAFAFLVAVASYPPRPQRALLYSGLFMFLSTTILVVYAIIKVEKDELLSRISRTMPDRIQFDLKFFGIMLLWLSPLIAVFCAHFFPGTWSWLISWIEPTIRTLN